MRVGANLALPGIVDEDVFMLVDAVAVWRREPR